MTERPALTDQLDRAPGMTVLRPARRDCPQWPGLSRTAASSSGALDAPAAVPGELGPGTVLTTGLAREALAPEFLVAAAVDTDVTCASADRGIPFHPGAGTHIEASTAWRAGGAAERTSTRRATISTRAPTPSASARTAVKQPRPGSGPRHIASVPAVSRCPARTNSSRPSPATSATPVRDVTNRPGCIVTSPYGLTSTSVVRALLL